MWKRRGPAVYLYFRRTKSSPRIRLPDDPTTQAFLTAYNAALTGQSEDDMRPREAAQRDTVASLIASYLRSAEYRSLRPTSKSGYFSRLEAIRSQHGQRSVSGLTRERINTGILAPYADLPGARLDTLKKLRILIRHAIEIGWLNLDPSAGIKRPVVSEIRAWTEEEIAAFEQRWQIGSKQRLAFALMLFSGQRRSDVHRMTWQDISGTTIRVTQQKTGARLVVAMHPDLQEILANTQRSHVTIVNTEFDRPFTVDGFGQWMRAAITAAGLPIECQPHGLRKAAGRRLAEAGCSAHEIMAVLGHKTLAEAERYTRQADQARLASSAILKLGPGRNANIIPQTGNPDLGKPRKPHRKQSDGK